MPLYRKGVREREPEVMPNSSKKHTTEVRTTISSDTNLWNSEIFFLRHESVHGGYTHTHTYMHTHSLTQGL